MPSPLDPARRRLAAACLLVLAAMALGAAPAAARFDLGMEDPGRLSGPSAAGDLAIARGAGLRSIRYAVSWAGVAPADRKPAGFDARDPADPAYRWGPVDAAVRAADAAHMRLLLLVSATPGWAEGPNRPATTGDVRPGSWDPEPAEVGAFARAIARRYSGRFPDPQRPGVALPRVREWEFWNEQNLPYYFDSPRPVPDFRRGLNTFYDNVKAVHRNSVVSVGGYAPVSFLGRSSGPLAFAAELMCLRRSGTRFVRRGCPVKAKFDAVATHPYSLAATPTKHAYSPDDVLVADMAEFTRLLRTAERLGTIAPARRGRPVWVTEWAWFTNPPNTVVGDRPAVAARYTALSLYLMWRADVSVVIWQLLHEDPQAAPPGGGLLTVDGRPKATMQAFGFPFFARVRGGRGYAWGKAPGAGRVVRVQRRAGRRWHTVARGRSRADGIFELRFAARADASFAALSEGRRSLAYDSRPVAPRRTHAFGTRPR